jgi:hypothetical protein
MTNDYQSLIQRNQLVPYALHGFGRASWCDYTVTMNASVKSFEIRVYANTPLDATLQATRLKAYIENNPMQNSSGHTDDISIGMRTPVLDPVSSAYVVTLIFNSGMLQIIDTKDAVNEDAFTNLCVTVGTDGVLSGFGPTFGAITPHYTNTGQKYYQLSWAKNGDIVLALGDDGTEQIAGVSKVALVNEEGTLLIILLWDGTKYILNDIDITNILFLNYSVGEKVCMGIYYVLDKMVDYSYKKMEVGA